MPAKDDIENKALFGCFWPRTSLIIFFLTDDSELGSGYVSGVTRSFFLTHYNMSSFLFFFFAEYVDYMWFGLFYFNVVV